MVSDVNAIDRAVLANADAFASSGQMDRMLEALRVLSLEQFGRLFLRPPTEYGHLAAALPRMASDDVQKSWTGTCGEHLLEQSVEFVRRLESGFRKHTGRELANANILDFGCGWGRLMRLMYRYTPPSRLYGVDPWEDSLAQCRVCGVLGNLALSDNIPRQLPFGDQKFDLIYAYSVFTHLSPKTAQIAQASLHQRLAQNGLLVITIRPESYWHAHGYWPEGYTVDGMIKLHRSDGVAYIPHIRPPTEGELTFGDISIDEDYIRRKWKGWQLVGSETSTIDPLQSVLLLKPKLGIWNLFR